MIKIFEVTRNTVKFQKVKSVMKMVALKLKSAVLSACSWALNTP